MLYDGTQESAVNIADWAKGSVVYEDGRWELRINEGTGSWVVPLGYWVVRSQSPTDAYRRFQVLAWAPEEFEKRYEVTS